VGEETFVPEIAMESAAVGPDGQANTNQRGGTILEDARSKIGTQGLGAYGPVLSVQYGIL
jgi:hypothetical protein